MGCARSESDPKKILLFDFKYLFWLQRRLPFFIFLLFILSCSRSMGKRRRIEGFFCFMIRETSVYTNENCQSLHTLGHTHKETWWAPADYFFYRFIQDRIFIGSEAIENGPNRLNESFDFAMIFKRSSS